MGAIRDIKDGELLGCEHGKLREGHACGSIGDARGIYFFEEISKRLYHSVSIYVDFPHVDARTLVSELFCPQENPKDSRSLFFRYQSLVSSLEIQ